MKSKEDSINLYYMNKGQAKNHKADDTIKRKKAKEREKRAPDRDSAYAGY